MLKNTSKNHVKVLIKLSRIIGQHGTKTLIQSGDFRSVVKGRSEYNQIFFVKRRFKYKSFFRTLPLALMKVCIQSSLVLKSLCVNYLFTFS